MREPYDVERHMLDTWSMVNPVTLLPAPSYYVDSITYALSRH